MWVIGGGVDTHLLHSQEEWWAARTKKLPKHTPFKMTRFQEPLCPSPW